MTFIEIAKDSATATSTESPAFSCEDGTCPAYAAGTSTSAGSKDNSAAADEMEEKRKSLRNITLTPLNCTFGLVTEDKNTLLPVTSMIKHHCKRDKTKVAIVIALRRPGCIACRETAGLINEYYGSDRNVSLICILKESGTSVINQAIQVLYSDYFPYPVYKDGSWGVYKQVLGNRRDSYFQLVPKLLKLKKRLKESGKAIAGTYTGGDNLTAGGILVFDKSGYLRNVLYENFGAPVEKEYLHSVINEAMVPLPKKSQSLS